MKHFYTKVLIIIIAIFSFVNIAKSQNVNTVIAFLKETPKASITDCTSEDLMNLLTEESKEWIESVECQNINLVNQRTGIQLTPFDDITQPTYLKITFNKKTILQAISIFFYGNGYDKDIPVNFYINDELKQSQAFDYSMTAYDASNTNILQNLKGSGTYTVPQISFTGYNPPILLKSCKIEIPNIYNSNQNKIIIFYGIRVYHNNIPIDISDISVAVEDLEAEQEIKVYEYYDLMGRRLAEAPRNGVFVRKCGGKVEKFVANGR